MLRWPSILISWASILTSWASHTDFLRLAGRDGQGPGMVVQPASCRLSHGVCRWRHSSCWVRSRPGDPAMDVLVTTALVLALQLARSWWGPWYVGLCGTGTLRCTLLVARPWCCTQDVQAAVSLVWDPSSKLPIYSQEEIPLPSSSSLWKREAFKLILSAYLAMLGWSKRNWMPLLLRFCMAGLCFSPWCYFSLSFGCFWSKSLPSPSCPCSHPGNSCLWAAAISPGCSKNRRGIPQSHFLLLSRGRKWKRNTCSSTIHIGTWTANGVFYFRDYAFASKIWSYL